MTTTQRNGNCTAGNTPFREKKSICQIALTIDLSGKMHLSFGTVKNLKRSEISGLKCQNSLRLRKTYYLQQFSKILTIVPPVLHVLIQGGKWYLHNY